MSYKYQQPTQNSRKSTVGRPSQAWKRTPDNGAKVYPEFGDHQCHACGSPLTRCTECKKLWAARRPEALTCSNACRQNRFQRLAREKRAEQ